MTEPRSSWLFIALAGVGTVAAGHWWGRSSSVAPRTAVVAEARAMRPAPVAAAEPSNQDTVHTPNTAVGVERRAGGENAEALGSAETGDELELEDEELLAEEARTEHFDELSRRIDGEVVDGAWRHETEGPLARLMSQHLGPKVSVSEATCASTFCRVKLSHPDWARIPPGSTFAFDLARASLEVTDVQYDNRSEHVTTLYFRRGPAPATQL
jgi:hypothetical protein